MGSAYLIFVANATNIFVEKKSAMWRNFCTWQIVIFFMWQIVMGKKLSTWEMWNKSVMWRNYVYNLWCFVALNGSKISFVAINAVLSRIFCRNLRAFVWRKKDKYQVWLKLLESSSLSLAEGPHVRGVQTGVMDNLWQARVMGVDISPWKPKSKLRARLTKWRDQRKNVPRSNRGVISYIIHYFRQTCRHYFFNYTLFFQISL